MSANDTSRNDKAMRGHGRVGKANINQRFNSNTVWQRYEQLKREIFHSAHSAEEYTQAIKRLADSMGV